MGEAEVYFVPLEQRVDELQLTHRGGIIMAGVYFTLIKENEKNICRCADPLQNTSCQPTSQRRVGTSNY